MSISLKSVRNQFLDGFYGVEDVVGEYKVWLSWIFYVICVRFNYSRGDYEYVVFRGVKRGDERYGFLICRKFKRLALFGEGLNYFSYGSHGKIRGGGLLATFEYDTNRFSLSDAWLRVGVDFNRSMSYLRKKFGKVSIARVWESHESGYPHIHAMFIFHEHVFSGYSSRRHGHLIYRVFGSGYKSLKGSWSYGFSDFEMVDSFRGGISYLSKYLVKSTSLSEAGSKGVKTLAMCWVFHRRSFAVSGLLFSPAGERGAVRSEATRAEHDEIRTQCISNLNSAEKNSDVKALKVGVDLYGVSIFENVGRWYLFGFCLREGVKWNGWRMHFVSHSELVCISANPFDGRRSYYDFVESDKRSSIVDGFSKQLSEFC